MSQSMIHKVPEAESTPQRLEVQAELAKLIPQFATRIQCTIGSGFFTLDFLYQAGETPGVFVGRYSITPEHAVKLRDLLNRQIEFYEQRIGTITLSPKGAQESNSPKRPTKPRLRRRR